MMSAYPETLQGIDSEYKTTQDDKNRWRTIELSIFNQKAQSLRFKYLRDGTNVKTEFFTENGHDIFLVFQLNPKRSLFLTNLSMFFQSGKPLHYQMKSSSRV